MWYNKIYDVNRQYQLTRGEGYGLLRPAITINLLAFELLPQPEPVAMYSIYNIKTGDRLNKDMELHFIEIPKYIKAPQKTISEWITNPDYRLRHWKGKREE